MRVWRTLGEEEEEEEEEEDIRSFRVRIQGKTVELGGWVGG